MDNKETKIITNGMTYKIKLVSFSQLPENNIGITYYCKREILISEELPSEELKATIIHEITHAVLVSHGYGRHPNNYELEELCEIMAFLGSEIIRLSNQAIIALTKEELENKGE